MDSIASPTHSGKESGLRLARPIDTKDFPKCLKYQCLLAGENMDESHQKKCLVDLPLDACEWLQDLEGYSTILALARRLELSTMALSQLLRLVDAHGKIDPNKRQRYKSHLDRAVEVHLLKCRTNPDDQREDLYSLGEQRAIIVKQCEARSRELENEIAKLQRVIAKKTKDLARKKCIWACLNSL